MKPSGRPREDAAARFWSKVQKTNGCWVWVAGKIRGGYGAFSAPGREGGQVRAHRFSWALANGPIPNGLNVLHRCDNPSCVRPDHLFLGTHAENRADCVSKGRQARGERHGSKTQPEKWRNHHAS